jgi:hypothetical protein
MIVLKAKEMQWKQRLKAKLTIIYSGITGCHLELNEGEDTNQTVFHDSVSSITIRKVTYSQWVDKLNSE